MVVLSGLGSDGAEGVRDVRRNGGDVIVQSESSARHFEMPRAAIESQAVDVVLPVAEIGPALRILSAH